MTEMTYIDPNDMVKFTDASKLQKGDYVLDSDGNELYLVLNKDYTSSNLICRDMQTGLKSSINPQGIQYYITREGWFCQRPGEAASGVKITEEDDQAIAETLRIAGVKLDEARGNPKYELDINIFYYDTGAYGTPASATLYSDKEGSWNICKNTIFNSDDDLEEYIVDQCVEKARTYAPKVPLKVNVKQHYRGGKTEEYSEIYN